MALIKSYTLKNGLTASEAYHIVSKVDTVKRAVDDPDPDGVRPRNSPDWVWKAGYYGRICVSIYASKAAREAGNPPIAMRNVYPTDVPYGFTGEMSQTQDFNLTLDISQNLIDQAYSHLLSLPEYSEALVD